MEKYEKAQMEVVEFENEDVISSSCLADTSGSICVSPYNPWGDCSIVITG